MRIAKELIGDINKRSRRNLSTNEEKILYGIFVSGMLDFRTIRKLIVPRLQKGNAHRCVRGLVRKGLLEPVISNLNPSAGWRLTFPIQRKFSQAIGFQGVGSYRFTLSIEEHNSAVRDIARMIDGMIETEWIAHEQMIRANEMAKNPAKTFANTLCVPDILIAVSRDDSLTRVAWELELTAKSQRRIEPILENRITSKEWERVVYVLGKGLSIAKMLEKNKRIIQTSSQVIRTKHANPILFVSEEDLRIKGMDAKGSMVGREILLTDFLKLRPNTVTTDVTTRSHVSSQIQ